MKNNFQWKSFGSGLIILIAYLFIVYGFMAIDIKSVPAMLGTGYMVLATITYPLTLTQQMACGVCRIQQRVITLVASPVYWVRSLTIKECSVDLRENTDKYL